MNKPNVEINVLRAMACELIANSCKDDWTVQGFGMMRYYISDVARIHIWHTDLRVPGVTDIHTHAWELNSIVLDGCISNTKYQEVDGVSHWKHKLITGRDGALLQERSEVGLAQTRESLHMPGEQYCERVGEIHRTSFENFTITIMQRNEGGQDNEAFSYYPIMGEWVSAKPREATPEEFQRYRKYAVLALNV